MGDYSSTFTMINYTEWNFSSLPALGDWDIRSGRHERGGTILAQGTEVWQIHDRIGAYGSNATIRFRYKTDVPAFSIDVACPFGPGQNTANSRVWDQIFDVQVSGFNPNTNPLLATFHIRKRTRRRFADTEGTPAEDAPLKREDTADGESTTEMPGTGTGQA